ncbi:hypothetical protein A3J90_05950 [candidate division WOR-1 bacterium RIFOXYC2_FULL_37_10]|uniref:ATPase domain-containing protein n=1 Tax=candidate division WOR-1 bacterium RIFOXYB2_FULL_37_13 TaxID=1802579 RepID=A0A1F4SWP5_UNCSA|nr:MAG: hypothetical protein A2310_03775 [candidate division WOR-1 bacterium RIFOXYB2_FULL_37_13]OGC34928.1 MAG: hypothetical protein A3J90_05950 [candidate division WOR-1 bacterium RIFOXYC2_FULL_37_10]
MSFTLLPVTDENFINRELLIKEMLDTLRDKSLKFGYALYGKRRVGKTSIFKELERILKKDKKIVPVYISVWDISTNSVNGFCDCLNEKTIDCFAPHLKLKHKAKDLALIPFNFARDILNNLKISISVKDLISFTIAKQPADKSPDRSLEDVFSLMEKLSAETNKKCILFIDEFPDIIKLKTNGSKIGEGIIKKTRTILEDAKNVVLCVSGSIKTTMRQAVLSSNSAFYKQFIVKLIEPLDKESIKRLFMQNFTESKFDLEALDAIYKVTRGYPFYAQFLGRILQKNNSSKIKVSDIENGMEEFLMQEGNILFKEEFHNLTDNEKNILREMSKRVNSTTSEISKKLALESSTTSKTLLYLQEKGLIEKEKAGVYCIEDPIFNDWLLKNIS